jgi:hypothetical protein
MKRKAKRPPSAALTCLGGLGCTGTPEITLKANARKVYLATLGGTHPREKLHL